MTPKQRARVRIRTVAVDEPSRPLKKPRQARSRFTVLAVFEAFVRIWRRAGWAGISTRAVALEAGYAVGTLYEYFPNREALLSGYVRHCLEALYERLRVEVIAPTGLAPAERLERLVHCTLSRPDLSDPWYDREMLLLEHRIATLADHRRSFGELCALWGEALARICPVAPDAAAVAGFLLPLWGGRRYAWLLDLEDGADAAWIAAAGHACARRFLDGCR